ncbi:MAG: hypothetical protein DWQ06_10775 [Calditrichaeota bacterium]|nr:MAG: hypothetical protein DWQ06_10775 [Calditrichota bacterium]
MKLEHLKTILIIFMVGVIWNIFQMAYNFDTSTTVIFIDLAIIILSIIACFAFAKNYNQTAGMFIIASSNIHLVSFLMDIFTGRFELNLFLFQIPSIIIGLLILKWFAKTRNERKEMHTKGEFCV